MKTIELTINTLNLDYVKEKIEEFNRKAKRLNKQRLEVSYSNAYINATDKEDIKELIDVIILQYEELIINDYKVIAKIDHTYPSKNFVKPYEQITAEQEKEYQHKNSTCQHCNSSRKRNFTFILQNINTQEYIQVGKSCLKDFIGHDIENSLRYFDLLEELQFNILNHGGDKKIQFFSTIKVLNMVKEEIRKNGYKSSKQKYNGEVMTSTGDDVKIKINDIYSNIDKRKHFLPAVKPEAMQEIKTIINYILAYDTTKETEHLQEFYNNLQNILKYEYCKFKDVSILATTFVVYDMLKAKEEKEKNNKISQHIGNIGDKIEIELTLESIYGYNTQYGYIHINLYKDAQGNVYKWSSKNILELEKGEFKKVKATIKNHEEYKGQKQTVITRCKIIEG